MSTVLITGANRGIGLDLCRRFKERNDEVIAVCRQASPQLKALDVEIHEGIDVTDDAAVSRLAHALDGRTIDVLVNDAGVMTAESLDDLDFERIRRQLEVNALGPLRVTSALLPALKSGSKVVIITSRMGSIGDNTSGGRYGYRMSKAAVNMAGVSLAHDLRDRGVAVAVLHPGMVATELTGGRGIAPAQAAHGLVARIDELDLESTGRFRHAEGSVIPW
jgi:NAD(P)-dependent dehydrogenase (short-subunit alcohol dehydrogenase family)